MNSSPSRRPWVCTQLSSPHAKSPERIKHVFWQSSSTQPKACMNSKDTCHHVQNHSIRLCLTVLTPLLTLLPLRRSCKKKVIQPQGHCFKDWLITLTSSALTQTKNFKTSFSGHALAAGRFLMHILGIGFFCSDMDMKCVVRQVGQVCP